MLLDYDLVQNISDYRITSGCVKKDELKQYSNGKPLYLLRVEYKEKFDVARSISNFGFTSPPQNFYYLKEIVNDK